MPGPIRFHRDESVDPAVADGLRRRGVDVTTPDCFRLQTKQLAFATVKQRTLVTHDEDSLVLSRAMEHTEIAYCHPESRSIGEIIVGLLLIRDCLTAEEMYSHVEFLQLLPEHS